MKLVHESRYPGLNPSQFRRLMADHEYQNAVATHGKQKRVDVQLTRHKGQVSTSWVAVLHRSLKEGVMRPLQAIWPGGIEVQWRETHVYQGNSGTMNLQVLQPGLAKASLQAAETLLMRDNTLVRRIEVDVGKTKLPVALRFLPGIKKGLAAEVERGLMHADECTAEWLKNHPGRYDKRSNSIAESGGSAKV